MDGRVSDQPGSEDRSPDASRLAAVRDAGRWAAITVLAVAWIALAGWAFELVNQDVKLDVRLDPKLASVMADPGQLEQVVVNLCVNARDAMPKGGTVTIATSNATVGRVSGPGARPVEPGQYVRLSVTDTGTGMDHETMTRIFEPFFTTKPEGMGTGLGLATVYGIIQQSGGHIWVTSQPGAGTTFEIYLSPQDGAGAGTGH